MSSLFTLRFSPAISPADPISVSGCNFTSSDNGITYTTTDRPNSLFDFSEQPWRSDLIGITNIPDSVFSIGNYCFYGSGITSIILPQNVTVISNHCFDNSTQLVSITLPQSLVSIGENAFQNCSSLLSITIPGSIQNFGISLFYQCTSLISVVIEEGVQSLNNSMFNACSAINSVTLPNSLTIINGYSFINCSSLSTIVIPNNVTTIQGYAFYGCSLNSITIPNTVTTIEPNAFGVVGGATLYTSPLNNTNPAYSFFNTTFGNNINYSAPKMPCFKENSRILTDKGYIPIQNLRKGDLVKTFKNDYKAIDMIGYRIMFNVISEERIKDKLYVCSPSEYPEVFEDLIITGCHSILVDDFKEGEKEKTRETLGHNYVTDGKYRLPACIDKRAKPYVEMGSFKIYHIALENDDYFMNYGIYANGLLVETTSKRYLKEKSNMTLIE